MTQPTADVALLTERRYAADAAAAGDWDLGNILQEDGLLREALRRIGLSSVRIDWSRPDVDWSRYRCAVFRTTWDYFDRFGFADGLRHLAEDYPFQPRTLAGSTPTKNHKGEAL